MFISSPRAPASVEEQWYFIEPDDQCGTCDVGASGQ